MGRNDGVLAKSQIMAFGSAGGPGLVAPSGCLSVCATRFRPWAWPLVTVSRLNPGFAARPPGLRMGLRPGHAFRPGAAPLADPVPGSLRRGKGIRLRHAPSLFLPCRGRLACPSPQGPRPGRRKPFPVLSKAGFGPAAPSGFGAGIGLGRPLSFFGPVGGSNSAGWFWPNPALKGTRGYALACFPRVSPARAP